MKIDEDNCEKDKMVFKNCYTFLKEKIIIIPRSLKMITVKRKENLLILWITKRKQKLLTSWKIIVEL